MIKVYENELFEVCCSPFLKTFNIYDKSTGLNIKEFSYGILFFDNPFTSIEKQKENAIKYADKIAKILINKGE